MALRNIKQSARASSGAPKRVSSNGKTSVKSVGKPTAKSEPAKVKSKGDALTDKELLQLVPGGLAHAFVTQQLHSKQLAIAGLSPPEDWQGDMPIIPNDIAAVDHDQLANLLGQFANAISTALWHSSKAYIEHGFYEEIVEYLEAVALLDSDQSNEAKRKAEARTDGRVMAARALAKSAYSEYVRFRDEARSLEIRLRTVSRTGGFVGDDADAGAASAIKHSTRGKAVGADKGNSKGSSRIRSRR